jgi:hypothetical protein
MPPADFEPRFAGAFVGLVYRAVLAAIAKLTTATTDVEIISARPG